MRRRLFAILAALVAIAASACYETATTTPELQLILARAATPRGVPAAVWADVQQFYAARAQKLAWLTAEGPTPRTDSALGVVRAAEAHGLDPEKYGHATLSGAVARLGALKESPEQAQAIADLDVQLTSSLLQLGRHVATGRLKPKSIDGRWNAHRESPDVVAALQFAADGEMTTFLDSVQPRHPEYQALKGALASLRQQAVTGWPLVPRVSMKIGQWNADVVRALRQRLASAGYLAATIDVNSPQYDVEVERAVKAFQEQHRLPVTGVFDRATADKMNVPIDARIKQLAVNLERWRWLPDALGERHFLINVPFFDLTAREQGRAVLDMRVVVGKRGNETPLFSDQMETVVFSPYWNIPETIALEETIPAIEKDPEYLARNNMEVVNAAGDVVPPEEIPWGDEGALGQLRFRQRPGVGNALGHVKFLFPNPHAVYLHDTPADDLFKRIGRAFSHGCVRVAEPERLAQYVLRDQPEWTPDAIQSSMRSGSERHVRLSAPIPVHIVYMTARVDTLGGLHLADDVYGYDARQARQ